MRRLSSKAVARSSNLGHLHCTDDNCMRLNCSGPPSCNFQEDQAIAEVPELPTQTVEEESAVPPVAMPRPLTLGNLTAFANRALQRLMETYAPTGAISPPQPAEEDLGKYLERALERGRQLHEQAHSLPFAETNAPATSVLTPESVQELADSVETLLGAVDSPDALVPEERMSELENPPEPQPQSSAGAVPTSTDSGDPDLNEFDLGDSSPNNAQEPKSKSKKKHPHGGGLKIKSHQDESDNNTFDENNPAMQSQPAMNGESGIEKAATKSANGPSASSNLQQTQGVVEEVDEDETELHANDPPSDPGASVKDSQNVVLARKDSYM